MSALNILISDLHAQYRLRTLRPTVLVEQLLARMPADDAAWISRVPEAQLRAAAVALEERLAAAGGDMTGMPLYGIPFAVKDNIDAAGLPTTAGCPAFAYTPTHNAAVVELLLGAGAVLLGKTNLDQFATGLVGTRSPYGAVPNTFRPEYISGGSSSGSASVVARGLASFALGTDTAGSGRVPAGFNNIVGLKPTRGHLSARGLVPACRSLDCISIFASTSADARAVLAVAGAYDDADAYSRPARTGLAAIPAAPRVGVPKVTEFFGDCEQAAQFARAVARMRADGAQIVEFDLAPFFEAAALLYQGPWVAERYAAIEAVMRDRPEVVDPVVREVIAQAGRYSAVDAFKAQYRLEEIRRATAPLWRAIDVMMLPTSPTNYTLDEIRAAPVQNNSRLGTYTNFVNLLDLSAIALPASMRGDGLPFGVTFVAPAWMDDALCEFGVRWQAGNGLPLGATGLALPASALVPPASRPASGWVRVAVVGAHLTGMPLNHQLTTRDARLVCRTETAPVYRLYALNDSVPPKPGLLRVAADGRAIVVELWDMPLSRFGEFVAEIPAPLAIGSLLLDDGATVKGFVCEPFALDGAEDISSYGGWRSYVARAPVQ